MSVELNNTICNLQRTLSKKTTFNLTKQTMMSIQENSGGERVF